VQQHLDVNLLAGVICWRGHTFKKMLGISVFQKSSLAKPLTLKLLQLA